MEKAKDIFDQMAESWPAEVVARTSLERFTGGLMPARTQANLDSKGEGPERIQIGRKIVYPKWPYVAWLRNRASK